MGCLQTSELSTCILCNPDDDESDDQRRRLRDRARDELLTEEVVETPTFQILSPIFRQEDVDDWVVYSLLSGHEPLRQGLDTLVEITELKYYDYDDAKTRKKQIKIFYEWYNDILYFYAHQCLTSEENTYFPWLETRTEKLPSKLTTKHREIYEMLDAIQNQKDNFFDSRGKLKENEFVHLLRDVHDSCIKLKREITKHLNEKEKVIPGLFRKYGVTQEEEGEIIEGMFTSLGMGNKILLPWIIDSMRQWGGQEFVDEFMQEIPGPVTFVYDKWWKGHYLKYNKGIVTRINNA